MYLLADILYFIAYYVVRYRRKVTRRNLTNSYPHMGDSELVKLERAYYRHMSDLLIEAIVNLYASPKWIMKHYRIVNRELVNSYYHKGQSVVLMSAHYNNWEYMITSLNFQLLHHGVGVGKPLNDKALATHVTRRRSRYGTEIVDQTNVRETMTYYHQHQVPVAYMMLSDQSPSNEHKSYWTTFMNQETPFLFGAEHFARKYNMPVLYYEVKKVHRGYYEVTFSKLCDTPNDTPLYTVTALYVQRLKATIDSAPQYWLWSHNRWKRHRPDDMPLHQALDTDITNKH